MQEQILKLRSEGKSYDEIVEVLGCTKSTVSYHCGEGQKSKTRQRQRKYRGHPVKNKLELFKNRRITKSLENRVDQFQRKGGEKRIITFTWKDVIEKFGMKTVCYLTGRPIDLNEPRTYSFDHVLPVSRGGDNSLGNLQVAARVVNQAKSDLTNEEFFKLCEEVLIHNGYSVNKMAPDVRLERT